MSGGTVVITTANCEVVLDAYGFYVRCTSPNCTYVSGYTAAKFRARQWAEAHDNDEPASEPEHCAHCSREVSLTPAGWAELSDPPNAGALYCDASRDVRHETPEALAERRRAYRSPAWLSERNNDPYGTPNGHEFWSTVEARTEGAWRLFERDGWTYGYDTRHNGWWHFATPQEAAAHVAGAPAGIDMWA